MVISEVPESIARKVRLLAAEHDRTRTDVLVIALRLVLDNPELGKKLEALLAGKA